MAPPPLAGEAGRGSAPDQTSSAHFLTGTLRQIKPLSSSPSNFRAVSD